MKQFYSFFPALIIVVGVVFFITQKNRPIPKEKKTDSTPFQGPEVSVFSPKSYEYELQRLRDPVTGKIPFNIRRLELEYASGLPGSISSLQTGTKMNLHSASSLTWQSRGPWNVGGRTRAFAVDAGNENKFLAGSTSGGMWTSTNGGASWSQSWEIAHQSVTCIVQDTRTGKTNTWYIGTGEGYGQSASSPGAYYLGNGVYKSTDGGATWNSLTATSSNTPQKFENVWDIIWNVVVNPADTVNNVVYASAYGAIMKSKNGGTSWVVVRGDTSAGPYSYFTDVAVTSSGVVYATLSSEGIQKGIWRSTDGTNWVNIIPLNFPAIYGRTVIGISPSDENQVYFLATTSTGFGKPDTNYAGQVEWNSLWKFHYDTAGGKWYNLSTNLPTSGTAFDAFLVQGGYDAVVRVHPTDTSIVFLGGTNLYRSTSGFFNMNNTTHIGGYKTGNTNSTWAATAYRYPNHHPDQHEIVFLPSNPGTMFSMNDGGIYKTTDNMAPIVTWNPLNSGYLTSLFYTVALDHSSPNDSTIIGGTQDNGSWFINSNNSMSAWMQSHGGDGSYCAIANNKSSYYFSVQNGKVLKAKLDAAGSIMNFASINPIGGKGYLFINPLTLDQNNNNIMYLAGGKNLWRNDSLNFIPMIGNWDSISKGWTKFPDTVPTAGAKITALAISKNPANILYYGTSNKRVYRIDNANTGTPTAVDITWGASSPNGFPNGGNVSCIAVDPSNAKKVLVAFSNYNVYSIFYSANADSTIPTWTKVAGNLEQNSSGTGNGPSIRWVSILPVSDGTVFLAATSTGIYATDTLVGTATLWAQQGANTIGNSICDMIDFRTSDGLVAVATHSRGIYTTNIMSKNDVLSISDPMAVGTLFQVYPNPFSYSATIGFTLNKNSKIKANIYDMKGRLIQTIAYNEFSHGEHHIKFSVENISTGVYYCVFSARTDPPFSGISGEMVETKKIILIK